MTCLKQNAEAEDSDTQEFNNKKCIIAYIAKVQYMRFVFLEVIHDY